MDRYHEQRLTFAVLDRVHTDPGFIVAVILKFAKHISGSRVCVYHFLDTYGVAIGIMHGKDWFKRMLEMQFPPTSRM